MGGGGGGGCFSEFIWDCKSIAPIFATEILVLALQPKHWAPHFSPPLPKHEIVGFQFWSGFVPCLIIVEL